MKSVLLLLVFITRHFLVAQTPNFNDIVNQYHSQNDFNGVVLVATHGNIDYIKSIGIADRALNTPIDITSTFKIASLTKVFTVVLTMKLVEDGKLNLGNTIGHYLPNYKGSGKDVVTIHHLLTYASGIENKLNTLGMEPYQTKQSLDDFINEYCSGDLVYTPGEKSEYGNTEYIVLHKIIEVVSEMSYEDFLTETILEPLNMKNTQMEDFEASKSLSGYLYNTEEGTFTKDVAYYPVMYFGSGGICSTTEDLLKFDQAIFNANILNEETTAKLLTINPSLGYTAYGFWGSEGWGNFNEKFYYRTGAILGSNANWIHTIENGKTIIVLSNTNATNLYELSEKLYLASIAE